MRELAERISGVEGVKYAIPMIDGQVLASGTAGAGTGALVRGIRGDDLGKLHCVADNIKQGSIWSASTAAKASPSAQRMAENLGLVLGDTITLVSPDGDVTPFGTTPRVKAYPVVGDLRGRHVGIRCLDHLHAARRRRSSTSTWRTSAQSIEIFVDNPDDVDALQPSRSRTRRRGRSI